MTILKSLWNCLWAIVFAIAYHAMTKEYRLLIAERIYQKLIDNKIICQK